MPLLVSALSGQVLPLLTPSLTAPGGLLQDYFSDLCYHLRRNDVIILMNCEQAFVPSDG